MSRATVEHAGAGVIAAEAQGGNVASRSTAVGVTLLATCLCQMDRIVFGTGAAGMLGTRFGANLYTGLFGTALLLIAAGLVVRRRDVTRWAAFGVAGMGAGLLLSPPSAMHGTLPTGLQITGYVAMLAGAVALVWGFLQAYPTRRPGPARMAAGGFGAAAGCSCCVNSGAIAGLAVAAGATLPGAPLVDGIPYVLFMAVAIYGLHRLAGRRYALVALAGAVLAFGGDEGLKPLMDGRIELIARLAVSGAGTALVVWAFARAFGSSRRPTESQPVPALG